MKNACHNYFKKWGKGNKQSVLVHVPEMVSLELRTLHKGFATLCTDMWHMARVCGEVFAHGSIVTDHFVATLMAQDFCKQCEPLL